MTCNDCGRDINYCDRHGCREANGVAWAKPDVPTERKYQCDVSQAGYYWARLIVREPPAHLPQKRPFPMLCDPSVVRVMRPGEPLEIVLSTDVRHRTTSADWIFLQRIPDYSPVPTKPEPR